MSFKHAALRDLVVERLALAADEIFALFERTFEEYEEEFVRLKSKQEQREELTVVQPLPAPLPALPVVQLSPEPVQEEQKPSVKRETPLELPVSSLPVKPEEIIENPAFLQQEPVEEQRPEPVLEQCEEEEPGCSLDLHSDNHEDIYSCSDTDDSNDWEPPAATTRTEHDKQDPDLVLIEDSNTSRDDENLLLSFPGFSGNTNLQTDLQTAGIFNLPIPPSKEPFKCSVCSRRFYQEAHLRSHMQTHVAEPLRCSVCGKEFQQRAHLKRHMQSHSTENSFSCPECGLRLKQQHNMHRHISAVHRREKPHSCLFCHKAFAQKSDFIIHMRTHTGEKPFVCPHCRKCFRVRASLNKHIQKSHAGV